MAIQILPSEPGIGAYLGQGLGQGLQLLAKQKLSSINAQREAPQIKALFPNITDEQAFAIAQLPPEVKNQFLNQYLSTIMGSGTAPSTPGIPGAQGMPGMVDEKTQRAIVAENKPFTQKIAGEYDISKEKHDLAKEALELLEMRDEQGNRLVQSGAISSLTPGRFQNAETQKFVTLLNKLVLTEAQTGKGVPSRMRLALEQLAKPQLWQRPGALKDLLGRIVKKAETPMSMERARRDIIAEHGGREPGGLETKARQRILTQKYNLPPTSDYSEGTRIEDKGRVFEKRGDNWIKVRGGS